MTPGEILVFNFIGFKTIQLKVGNESSCNVTLESENVTLDEVVVVRGYGIKKKKDLIGSIVSAKDSVSRPVVNAVQVMQYPGD